MKAERREALLRIPISLVTWIILEIWGLLALVIAIINLIYTIIFQKRSKEMANFTNTYIGYLYTSVRYIFLTTNKRPFPFGELEKPVEKISMKAK